MKEKDNVLNVGDFVAPRNSAKLIISDDISEEDLMGFIIDKNTDIITVEGIGRGIITSWKESRFEKTEIPEIFKRKNIIRKRD